MSTEPSVSLVPDESLILVGVLPSPRDLEIARLLGWYRIPIKTAPKVIDVDFLAFYQTAAFGEEGRWQIHYIAAVTGHELTTRAELIRAEPDHPRAGEEYFKIQLGPLKALAKPIEASRWRRMTFVYTTGSYFNHAKTLSDLVVRSEERTLLWRSLRERAVQAGSYRANELPEMEIDPAMVELINVLGFTLSEDMDASVYRPDERE